ncbi:50S ribosomal protein L18 [Nanoarchaeota archaeon]
MTTRQFGKKRTVPYRRKREGRTHYGKRLTFLKSGLPRLVVRKLGNTIVCQFIQYDADGDKIIAAASSRDLKKLGWNGHPRNTPSAYLTGLLVGQKAKKSVKEAILDLGLQNPRKKTNVYAALKGVIDAGVAISHDETAIPADDRLTGKHIADYASKIAGTDAYKSNFSAYIKINTKPEELVKMFDDVKNKILGM